MKILIAGTSFFPQYNAGTEVYLQLLSKTLRQLGQKTTIVCGGDPETPFEFDQKWKVEQYTYETDEVHRIVRNPRYSNISDHFSRTDLEREHLWRQLISELCPDAVILAGRAPALMGDLEIVCNEKRIPVVWTLIHPDQLCPKGTRINQHKQGCHIHIEKQKCNDCIAASHGVPTLASKISCVVSPLKLHALLPEGKLKTFLLLPTLIENYINRWNEIKNSVPAFVAHSRAAQDLLSANGVALEKIHFSPPGFTDSLSNRALIDPVSPKLVNIRFGFIGRLCADKGIHTLIKCWKTMKDVKNASLTIWGNPTTAERGALRAIEQISGTVGNITFRGAFARTELPNIFNAIDVLIVPSEWFDNCPFVISESFLYGRPVIGSDFGGIATMIEHGKNGWLFPMGDSQSLRNIISQLCLEPQQVSQAATLTKTPRAFLEHAVEIKQLIDSLG